MTAFDDAESLRKEAMGQALTAERVAQREEKVRRDFWSKLKRVAGRVPFMEDLVAGYYCALDSQTPLRVRGMLLAVIAYFILPMDLMPDIVLGLGFADDAALLTGVLSLVSSHITPAHRAAAARALEREFPDSDTEDA
ncbi:YkvA family protein [Methyloligella solikamskensis]|uniref:YkvA family protein n=1 Tax=Methyloligella solikamskensis TaxID=1177756 RepID=A0ABW3J5Z3_9HYPH